MLPIVNEAVEGAKVSIYNQRVHAKHPLYGFRLRNATALHLSQGPMTVFDGGVLRAMPVLRISPRSGTPAELRHGPQDRGGASQ